LPIYTLNFKGGGQKVQKSHGLYFRPKSPSTRSGFEMEQNVDNLKLPPNLKLRWLMVLPQTFRPSFP